MSQNAGPAVNRASTFSRLPYAKLYLSFVGVKSDESNLSPN